MVVVNSKESSHWWWFDSHTKDSTNRSPWLQSTLTELDKKTKAMLNLIEEDADTFAQRAEMYYKKRPELVTMVEDFYRTHRYLAEQYDHARSEAGSRLPTPWSSPLSFTKYRLEKSSSMVDKTYDSYSEACDESEIDNPEELLEETEPEEEVLSPACNEEMIRLREEVERLTEEREVQKQQLKQKDEEKREVIRQLSFAIDLLREENVNLRKNVAKNAVKRENMLEFGPLKEGFLGRLFSRFAKSEDKSVALQSVASFFVPVL